MCAAVDGVLKKQHELDRAMLVFYCIGESEESKKRIHLCGQHEKTLHFVREANVIINRHARLQSGSRGNG